MAKKVGVLALQGAYRPHISHLAAAGAESLLVRRRRDLEGCDGLILPGGESSTMLKLIQGADLEKPLAAFLRARPSWGICAGAILLAARVENPPQFSFGILDMTVLRNGYGAQLESRESLVENTPVCYIRAPVIESVGPGVAVCARRDSLAVWVENRGPPFCMATTFHPELKARPPSFFHEVFVRHL